MLEMGNDSDPSPFAASALSLLSAAPSPAFRPRSRACVSSSDLGWVIFGAESLGTDAFHGLRSKGM